jgi:hypothetical protein
VSPKAKMVYSNVLHPSIKECTSNFIEEDLNKSTPTFMPPNLYHWIHDEIYIPHIAIWFLKYCYIFG